MIIKTLAKCFAYIGHSFRTVFGFYQKPYSEEWDQTLNLILTEAESGNINHERKHCTIKLGTEEIWIENQWYSYGSLYRSDVINDPFETMPEDLQFRPKFSTMLRLHRFVTNTCKIDNKNRIRNICNKIERNLT